MYEVYLSLGSNLGNREAFLTQAQTLILSLKGVSFIQSSKTYLTEPWGNKNQNWFLNKVLYITCSSIWNPFSFLRELLKIEKTLGRKRTIRWGPRNIDIDILLFGDYVINTKELTLPHPRIKERAFVLVPLLELNPSLTLPTGEVLKKELQNLNFRLKDNKIYQHL